MENIELCTMAAVHIGSQFSRQLRGLKGSVGESCLFAGLGFSSALLIAFVDLTCRNHPCPDAAIIQAALHICMHSTVMLRHAQLD